MTGIAVNPATSSRARRCQENKAASLANAGGNCELRANRHRLYANALHRP